MPTDESVAATVTASTMSTSNTITFYDIAMKPPVEENCCAPNPWKTRLALNFKGVPYSTTWVPLPDVAKVRKGLKLPPCRKFADGTDFYTLPIIEDPTTNSSVGDSYDIAEYLQKTYPDSGAGDLFPEQNLDFSFNPSYPLGVPLTDCRKSDFPEYAKFNVNADAAFTAHVGLVAQHMPFDPATAEISKAEFVRRAGVSSWDDFKLEGEAREKILDSFQEMLGPEGLGKLFLRDTSGPFILGSRPSYADLIVGAWLRYMRVSLPTSEWERVRSWHDGLFGKLHDALEVYAVVK